MAKGKKSSGSTYVSKGERPNVSRNTTKAMRRDYMQSLDREVNQTRAWRRGKRVMLTIPNPNPDARRERFIRVEAREVWGNPFQKRNAKENTDG